MVLVNQAYGGLKMRQDDFYLITGLALASVSGNVRALTMDLL